jgi:hypothetical protein
MHGFEQSCDQMGWQGWLEFITLGCIILSKVDVYGLSWVNMPALRKALIFSTYPVSITVAPEGQQRPAMSDPEIYQSAEQGQQKQEAKMK